MLHILYSNSCELLRAALITNIRFDRGEMKSGADRAFSKIEVITPGDAVTHDLRRTIASLPSGICCGIRFVDIGSWFSPFGGHLVGTGNTGKTLEWLIWSILSDCSFTSRHTRLSSCLKNSSASDVYRLALKTAAVFSVYASYRLDWVLRWFDEGEGRNPAPPEGERELRESRVLRAHPDFLWQKELWAELARRGWTGARILSSIPEKLGCSRLSPGTRLHIYLPRRLPPLVLPFLKRFAAFEEIRLYLLNPCAEYWFEQVPKNLFNWRDQEDGSGLRYLRRNAASTRALIDRIWTFASDPDTASGTCDGDGSIRKGPGCAHRVIEKADIGQLDRLRLDREADQQLLAVDTTARAGSLLGPLQRSILRDDDRELDNARADGSLLFVKAPDLPREIEAATDWIQQLLSEDSTVEPDDILIVTPDIDGAAPSIESTMNSLPSGTRFAFNIVGRSSIFTSSAAAAVLEAGKFLTSRASASDFYRVVEHPLVSSCWKLAPTDIAILRRWLKAAGYRYGIDDRHIDFLIATGKAPKEGKHCDGTLKRALERLTAASMIGSDTDRPFLDILPIRGDEEAGFDTVTSREDLFKTLCALSSVLSGLRPQATELPAGQWKDWASRLADALFPCRRPPDDVLELRRSIAEVSSAATDALGTTPVSFDVFWLSVETRCRTTSAPARASGRVTFAPMSAFRGLPFRAIAFIGMDEGQAFPGTGRSEEFDLMQAEAGGEHVKRRGDRDSRNDNRNLFLDLLLAAREKVFISWSVGTDPAVEKNPSSVIQDLRDFLACRGGEAVKNATIRIPLASYSAKNFTSDAPLRSHRPDLCEAVREAAAANYLARPPVFSEGVNLLTGNGGRPDCLPFRELTEFLARTGEWSAKRAGIAMTDVKANEAVPLVLPADSRLKAMRKKFIIEKIENGRPGAEIAGLLSRSPAFGIEKLREKLLGDEIHEIERQRDERDEAAAGLERFETRNISLALSSRTTGGLSLSSVTLFRNSENKDEPSLLAELSPSETEKFRTRLKYVFLNAAGIRTRLWDPDLAESAARAAGGGRKKKKAETAARPKLIEPVDRIQAKRIIDSLMALMDAHLEMFPVLPANRRNPENDVLSDTLWEGLDRDIAERRRESLDRALDSFFEAAANGSGVEEKTSEVLKAALEASRWRQAS